GTRAAQDQAPGGDPPQGGPGPDRRPRNQHPPARGGYRGPGARVPALDARRGGMRALSAVRAGTCSTESGPCSNTLTIKVLGHENRSFSTPSHLLFDPTSREFARNASRINGLRGG